MPFEPFIGAEGFSRYPDQQPAALVDALCRLYDVSSRNLVVTRGADEGIDLLIRAFCTAGQDNIIACPPGFAMYGHSASLQGIALRTAKLTENFALDFEAIKSAADENTKIIFLCSPNNPTANLMDRADIKSVCAYFKDTALVVVDETYIEFAGEDASMITEIERTPNLVILRTLSKSYAAAGLRCGVAIGPQEVMALLLKVLAPYPLPQPAVQAALQILQPKNLERLAQKRNEILARRDAFIPQFEALDDVICVYPSDANFILLRVKDADTFIEKAALARIILRNQSYQTGLDNCVRISIGTEEDMLRLLAALKGEDIPQNDSCRIAYVARSTKETSIAVHVNLDQSDPVRIETGIPFYDHMLEQIARHGGFGLTLECDGDLDVEAHHTIEDCAIALGQALKKALGDKRGIGRYGSVLPMDESLAQVALDLSGRFYLDFKATFPDAYVGNKDNPLPVDMIEHIFRSLAENLQANLHIAVTGENTHHMVEACFKALGRALHQAIRIEGDALPSTKGTL
jgi:histidinol-phosphate aminotransferase/imidazoleglycerol-phosphate dehydratase/histidinol-phosphatase